MNKKYDYEYVKKYVESYGYELLSTEYKRSDMPLFLMCPKGHKYYSSFSWFKNKNSRCTHNDCVRNKKHTYEHVKETIEKEGYKLLSTEYTSTNVPLDVQCDKGHLWKVSFKEFKHGTRCRYCYGNDFRTQEEIKKAINVDGYKMLSEYKGAKSKLSICCPEGHIFEMRPNNFKNGQRCPVCAGNIRYDIDFVNSIVENEGYKLLSKEYKNAHQKLKIICPNEHVFDMRFSDFKNGGQRCPKCSFIDKKSKPESEIYEYLKTLTNEQIIENDRSIVKNPLTNFMLELDLYIPTLKKAIEFNGIYWHSKENVKQRDVEKMKQCKERGIELLVVDEREWLDDKNQCLDKIKNWIFVRK